MIAVARPAPRRAAAAGAALLAGLTLAACTEAESTSSATYEPTKLHYGADGDVTRVEFTAEGARRTGLQTALVRRSGADLVVPYAALIYDSDGTSHVYTSPRALTYVNTPVTVRRIDAGRDRVLLKTGPPSGAQVVTVGAAEVWGAELDIAGDH